jgi:hypothetical protein
MVKARFCWRGGECLMGFNGLVAVVLIGDLAAESFINSP